MTVTRFKKHNKRKVSRKHKGTASRSKVHLNKKNSTLRKNGKSMRNFKQMGGARRPPSGSVSAAGKQPPVVLQHEMYEAGTTRNRLEREQPVQTQLKALREAEAAAAEAAEAARAQRAARGRIATAWRDPRASGVSEAAPPPRPPKPVTPSAVPALPPPPIAQAASGASAAALPPGTPPPALPPARVVSGATKPRLATPLPNTDEDEASAELPPVPSRPPSQATSGTLPSAQVGQVASVALPPARRAAQNPTYSAPAQNAASLQPNNAHYAQIMRGQGGYATTGASPYAASSFVSPPGYTVMGTPNTYGISRPIRETLYVTRPVTAESQYETMGDLDFNPNAIQASKTSEGTYDMPAATSQIFMRTGRKYIVGGPKGMKPAPPGYTGKTYTKTPNGYMRDSNKKLYNNSGRELPLLNNKTRGKQGTYDIMSDDTVHVPITANPMYDSTAAGHNYSSLTASPYATIDENFNPYGNRNIITIPGSTVDETSFSNFEEGELSQAEVNKLYAVPHRYRG